MLSVPVPRQRARDVEDVLNVCGFMPNQYTKFRAAVESSSTPDFRWREYTHKEQNGHGSAKRQPPHVRSRVAHKRPQDGDRHRSALSEDGEPSSSESLLRYLPSGGLRVDPFRSFPVHPDRSEYAVLDHCEHRWYRRGPFG